VGFTFRSSARRIRRRPTAAIILQLEAVVAALSGWLILGETLGTRGLAGCLLMLAGMIIASSGRCGRVGRVPG
jgi:drug/metabolite transporter (DMT)-like permease